MKAGGEQATLLLDVEGTTTPVAFVHEVLFPYARRHARDLLRRRGGEPAVRSDLEALRREHAEDVARGEQPPPWPESAGAADLEGALAYLGWLMDRDRKSTALKSLQGRIWEDGFCSGALEAAVYPDVPPAFARWHAAGRGPWIFSSGSVLAQRLLFAHTTAGDLTRLIRGYFDTTTGPKKEAESYRTIAGSIGLPAGRLLFVSDVTAELDAARQAGLQTALCVREGAPPAEGHTVITDFAGI